MKCPYKHVKILQDEHPQVAETAVVGFPHEIKGEGVYAYVILRDDATDPVEKIVMDVKHSVKEKIGSFAVPELIQVWCKISARISLFK